MKKIIYTLSFACALLFAPKVIIAQTFKSGNIYYKVISPNTPRTVAVTYSSTAGEKYSGSVNIPASVSYSGASYSVVSIDSAAFSACTGLTSVTIPSTVRYIGNYAFRNCSALSLPNFAALTALDSIGYSAFYNCTSFLGALNLPNSLIRIGDNAFDSCTGLTNALVLPSSLKWLGNQVFFYCTGLTGALVLPNNLSHIGVAPFEQCAGIITPTETLTIPDSVTYIAFFAFLGFNNLKTINFNAKKCETMADLTDQSHEKVAFYNCNAVKTINIGANVTKIPNYGFSKLTTVQSIKSDAITPPQIYAQTFKDIATNIPVTVSCNSAAVYSAATYWNNFTNIQGFGSVSVPYDLQAANESASIKLQWQGSATSYKIYRNNTLIATVGVKNYTDNNITLGNSYCYQIRVANTNTACADAVSNEVCTTYSAVNELETKHFKIYPVPASDRIFIEGDLDYSDIKIYDIYGREVLTSAKTDEINISNLPQGNYLVNILNKGISIERVKIAKK